MTCEPSADGLRGEDGEKEKHVMGRRILREEEVEEGRAACLEAAALQDMAVSEALCEDGKCGELVTRLVWVLQNYNARASLQRRGG